jgi:hypothetical protein
MGAGDGLDLGGEGLQARGELAQGCAVLRRVFREEPVPCGQLAILGRLGAVAGYRG